MTNAQAKKIVAVLVAGFRERYMPPSTVNLWAKSLERFDVDVAGAVAVELYETYDSMPSLRQVLNAMGTRQRAVQREREREQLALTEGVPPPVALFEDYWRGRNRKALPA